VFLEGFYLEDSILISQFLYILFNFVIFYIYYSIFLSFNKRET